MNKLEFKFILIFLAINFIVKAQFSSDSLHKTVIRSPKTAVLYSLIPGGGQIYNKVYWKVPVIYAAFTGLIYFINSNNNGFNECKQEYIYRVNNPTGVNGMVKDPHSDLANYSLDDLLTLKNDYEKYRNLCVVGIIAVYVLNLVDAAVDAHLKNFDISNNLAIEATPYFNLYSNNYTSSTITGFNLTLKF